MLINGSHSHRGLTQGINWNVRGRQGTVMAQTPSSIHSEGVLAKYIHCSFPLNAAVKADKCKGDATKEQNQEINPRGAQISNGRLPHVIFLGEQHQFTNNLTLTVWRKSTGGLLSVLADKQTNKPQQQTKREILVQPSAARERPRRDGK